MRAAAELLKGEHDFSAFRSPRCAARSAVRRIEALDVLDEPLPLLQTFQPEVGALVALRVRARSFLYNQVRYMVAALLECGAGRMSPAQCRALLDGRDVTKAPVLAPPHGLYLAAVDYPEEAHEQRRSRWDYDDTALLGGGTSDG